MYSMISINMKFRRLNCSSSYLSCEAAQSYGNPFRTKLAKNHGQMRIEKNATLSNSFSNDNGKMQHSQIHSQMTMEK